MGRKRKRKERVMESNRSLISHYRSRSPISERYRAIRTSIQFASLEKEIRMITVTSASPGEGKSTTASNLAIVLAQQDHNVLLVDMDMRKPTCHSTFRVENQSGLTNVLFNLAKLSEVVHKTAVPNLSLLTSGPIPPNPAELLSRNRMDWVLNEARLEYDYIILDTPPILTVTDAQIVAQKSDGVVLVISNGKTTKESAAKAKELLLKARANILGVILNRKEKKFNKKDSYYYGTK
ncbi:CpsD/CapB family tyrosine-protein kinase [Ferdinandcohnia sp. Marseille-Q9671]